VSRVHVQGDLRADIESLHCEHRLSSDEQFDAVMAYIMAILGER